MFVLWCGTVVNLSPNRRTTRTSWRYVRKNNIVGIRVPGHRFVGDHSRSITFQDIGYERSSNITPWWAPSVTENPAANVTSLILFTVHSCDPTYTTIAISFEPLAAVSPGTTGRVGNTDEVAVRSQFIAHYTQGTMLANLAMDPGTANKQRGHQHWGHEECQGSRLEQFRSTCVWKVTLRRRRSG